jgi:hypothetical protein
MTRSVGVLLYGNEHVLVTSVIANSQHKVDCLILCWPLRLLLLLLQARTICLHWFRGLWGWRLSCCCCCCMAAAACKI